MIGQKISTRVVKARWAWSELTSPRFARKYTGLGPDAVRLQQLAQRGTAFDDLTHSDIDILVSLIEKRQSGFMPSLNPIREFVCAGWTKAELLTTEAIPAMSPNKDRMIPYSEFIKNPPHVVNGQPEWSDPRVSVDSWPSGKPFEQPEPAIAIVAPSGRKMLVDGYGRSVIFVHLATENDRFLVWEPVT